MTFGMILGRVIRMNLSNDNIHTIHQIYESLDLEQAKRLIIERSKQLVNQLIEERGHDKPPFLPEEFYRLLGVSKTVKTNLGKVSAVLMRFQNGYIIKINENQPFARQNFSCAHELGHILFSDLKLGRCLQNIEYRRTFNPQATERLRIKAIERLCDVAATEILMPELVFSKYLSSFGVSVNSIELLSNIFKVSNLAVAIRIAEVNVEPCLSLLWQTWQRAKTKVLRLNWCIGPRNYSQNKGHYVPVHKIIPINSNLYKAYQSDSPVKSFKLFKVNDTVRRLPMESKGFGYGENRQVISLAFLER